MLPGRHRLEVPQEDCSKPSYPSCSVIALHVESILYFFLFQNVPTSQAFGMEWNERDNLPGNILGLLNSCVMGWGQADFDSLFILCQCSQSGRLCLPAGGSHGTEELFCSHVPLVLTHPSSLTCEKDS